MQMNFLNKAMITFGASEVVPVYYVTFNLCSIAAGMLLYREYKFQSNAFIGLFLLGVAVTFAGVFLINVKRGRSKGTSAGDLGVKLMDDASEEPHHAAPMMTTLDPVTEIDDNAEP
mmetsp:Transcript_15143/g.35950  ORF Transcript_15143/g.35950 Transcript_15143/m.35950 type:complete len:116 (+) Transcript_15143:715-1062(+)